MATAQQSNKGNQKDFKGLSEKNISIVVSEWNDDITDSLYIAAHQTLVEKGISSNRITKVNVPGSFELPLAALWEAKKKSIDAVICIGCIIQGETRHFEFIAQSVAQGITDVSLRTKKPIAFGVLTTDSIEQAIERAGTKAGNKGAEAAMTALEMINLLNQLEH